MRKDGVAELGKFFVPGASEVCINVHIKAEIAGGSHDDAFIFCKK